MLFLSYLSYNIFRGIPTNQIDFYLRLIKQKLDFDDVIYNFINMMVQKKKIS